VLLEPLRRHRTVLARSVAAPTPLPGATRSRPEFGEAVQGDFGGGPVRSRLPDAVLWRADRCSGRLRSGAHATHERRLDGVEERLVPRAQPGAERAAHLDHVAHADLLRPHAITGTRAVPSVSVKAV